MKGQVTEKHMTAIALTPHAITEISTNMNTFTFGPNTVQLDLAGYTIAQTELAFSDVLNVGPWIPAFVDGKRVENKSKFVLRRGQAVVFWKVWGWKGSGKDIVNALNQIVMAIESNTNAMNRLVDHFSPPDRATVTSSYVARRLGCTVRWIGELARRGDIPKSCRCPRSGEGKYWRFWKKQTDEWIDKQ
jgi:hypothetical protein